MAAIGDQYRNVADNHRYQISRLRTDSTGVERAWLDRIPLSDGLAGKGMAGVAVTDLADPTLWTAL